MEEMTDRIIGPSGGKRRRRFLALFAFAALAPLALAVNSFGGPVGTASGFEDDDGNLAPGDIIEQGEPSPNFDWNSFAPTTWTGTAPYRESNKGPSSATSGWTFKGIEDAQVDKDDTVFAGGVKQDDDCAKLQEGPKAPNKDDLKRIYLSTKNVSGNTFLNLAWVRIPQNTTSSSAHVAFEFNQGTAGPCPGSPPSSELVKRVAGDMLIVYDFEGGSDEPVITLRRWVTSGACEVGSSIPPCWGPATNLTNLGFAEAKVNTFGSVTDQIAPSGTESLGTGEFGEAGINLTAAGVFGAGSCASFGTAFGVSRSSGNSGTAQMKDIVGPADFTLANCGTVIIHKNTVPDDANTEFDYTTNVTTTPTTTTSPFSLTDPGDATETIVNVNPGTGLNVTESDPTGDGYKLTDIDCSVNTTVPSGNYSTNINANGAGGAVTFSLAAGELLECTFKNEPLQGALRILKQSTKTGNPLVKQPGATFSVVDGTSFTVRDNNVAPAGSKNDEVVGTSGIGEVCVSGLAPGSYTVNETSPPTGYGAASQSNQTAVVVDGTNCAGNKPTNANSATFTNPPLADIQVRFKDGGSGETALTTPVGDGIDCDNATGSTAETSDTDGWDNTDTVTGVKIDPSPQTITCTIEIDP